MPWQLRDNTGLEAGAICGVVGSQERALSAEARGDAKAAYSPFGIKETYNEGLKSQAILPAQMAARGRGKKETHEAGSPLGNGSLALCHKKMGNKTSKS